MVAPFIVGIDLGTSNSCAAVYDRGTPTVIVNELGARVTPSAVAFLAEDKIVVGEAARRQAIMNPAHTIINVKRLIGRSYDSREIKSIRAITPYEILKADNGDAWVAIGDRLVSPPEIQAHVLSALQRSSELYLESELCDVVITVPAFFDETQRQATRDAAEIAGMRAARIVSESTAAALAFGYTAAQESRIAVVDLGGGTLDVTIMAAQGGQFTTLATAGDMLLGGADFDRMIAVQWAREIERTHGVNPLVTPVALQRLVHEAEAAKVVLSSEQTVSISLPYLLPSGAGPIHFERSFSRDEFKTVVAPLVGRIARPCHQALQEAGLAANQIDDVLLVGGMTRATIVRQTVAELFGTEPLSRVNPDEAVALGAAVLGGVLRGDVPKANFVDVAPKTIGIRAAGDRMVPLIKRSSTLPAAVGKTFAAKNREKGLKLEVLQGESGVASENRRLGWVSLDGLPEDPSGKNAIRVAFAMNEEGSLEVSAMSVATKSRVLATIRPSSGLTRPQIEKLALEFSAGGGDEEVDSAATKTLVIAGEEATHSGEEAEASGETPVESESPSENRAAEDGNSSADRNTADNGEIDAHMAAQVAQRSWREPWLVVLAALVFVGIGAVAYVVYGS